MQPTESAAMPIYYALLARRRVVLCDYADVSGNFESLSQAVLERLPTTDTKISYESGTYLFHCVVSQGLSFICVTEATFDRNVAYAYLFELQRQLASARLEQRAAIAGPYALRRDFSGVVESLMHRYSSSDHLTSLQTQVDDVKGIMTENIEKVIRRGEALEDIQERSDSLLLSSAQFRTTATKLKRKMCFQSCKCWTVCIFIILVILAVVVTLIVLAVMHKL